MSVESVSGLLSGYQTKANGTANTHQSLLPRQAPPLGATCLKIPSCSSWRAGPRCGLRAFRRSVSQAERGHDNRNGDNSSATIRKKHKVRGDLQDLWRVKQGRGILRRERNRCFLRQVEGRGNMVASREWLVMTDRFAQHDMTR